MLPPNCNLHQISITNPNMDIIDEPTHTASGPVHTSVDDLTKVQACEASSCSSATGSLEVRSQATTPHTTTWTTVYVEAGTGRIAHTTTWTTEYVGSSTTDRARTTTETGWTETLSSPTSHEDPLATKWVTETVAGSATDPGWASGVTSPPTTTTTTLTPVAVATEVMNPLRELPWTSKSSDIDLLTAVTSDDRDWRVTQ